MDRVGGGHIRVASLDGGPFVSLTDSLVGAPGVVWGTDGFIYYDRVGTGPLMRVSDKGGRAESIGQLDSAKGELQHSWPNVLPNGRGVIMTVSRGGPGSMGGPADEIAVLDLATGAHRASMSIPPRLCNAAGDWGSSASAARASRMDSSNRPVITRKLAYCDRTDHSFGASDTARLNSRSASAQS
jgi:hypothetical protein